ncbi:MAG TPA: acyl-CoA thioesterase domain-containing protein [Caulobacteraceae bacterium]|nr:acyl-CoA thioesterase domain-containing protein [Caulobacteraceae bacterium]
MPIFERDEDADSWRPTPLARGPFAGLQGGAVAALLTAEAERCAALAGYSAGVGVSAWFLRPAPDQPLRTRTSMLHARGRMAVVDAMLSAPDDDAPLAVARVTFLAERDLSALAPASPNGAPSLDPATLPERRRAAPHGGRWMMDAMEARLGPDGAGWFKLRTPPVAGAGPLASVLPAADWAHGLARPAERVFADPNPTLNVQLLRPPASGWVGVRAATHWRPEVGAGFGAASLVDEFGVIGAVSMAVALTPFAAPAERREPA